MKNLQYFFTATTLMLLFFSTGYAQINLNGVCWATCNVDMPGTFAANPEDAGMFYQWGSNVGWSSTDPLIASDGINTWRNLSQSGNIWLPEKNPCPAGWRVPTQQEFQSLINAGSYWGLLNGINGRFFGNEEPRLFFSASGYRAHDGTFMPGNPAGFYWSCTPFNTEAYNLFFRDGNILIQSSFFRTSSFSIRCVAAQYESNVSFYANNVYHSDLPDTTFCKSYVSFLAEMECLNPDSLKWYVNEVEEILVRDSLEWGRNFPNGNYDIVMKAYFENYGTITITSTLKVQTLWIKMRNIRY